MKKALQKLKCFHARLIQKFVMFFQLTTIVILVGLVAKQQYTTAVIKKPMLN